jgi:HEAT repeat protein
MLAGFGAGGAGDGCRSALGVAENPVVQQALLTLCADPVPSVRQAAALALERVAEDAAVRPVLQ